MTSKYYVWCFFARHPEEVLQPSRWEVVDFSPFDTYEKAASTAKGYAPDKGRLVSRVTVKILEGDIVPVPHNSLNPSWVSGEPLRYRNSGYDPEDQPDGKYTVWTYDSKRGWRTSNWMENVSHYAAQMSYREISREIEGGRDNYTLDVKILKAGEQP